MSIAATLRALRAIGHDRWLTVEAFGAGLPELAAATQVWRPLFADEDEVVRDGIKAIRAGLAA